MKLELPPQNPLANAFFQDQPTGTRISDHEAFTEYLLGAFIVMRDKDTLRVSTWKVQAIGWAGLIFFSFCLVLSWISGQRNVSPWFLPFILMSLPVLLLSGPVYATTEVISLRCPVGTFQIAWTEIKRVEFGQASMVLFAESKRLPMPGPSFWSGADKSQILKLMDTFCQEDKIEIAQTFRADYLFPKNTKVA